MNLELDGGYRSHHAKQNCGGGVLLSLFFLACGTPNADTWTPTVYPDQNDLTVSQTLRATQSLQECRNLANATLALEDWENGDYECGLNCRKMFPELEDSVLICKETLR